MGIMVSAAQAGWLVSRNERQVRERIRRGELAATPAGPSAKREGSGPSRWAIDTDDLARIPGWRVDASRLAQLQAQQRSQPETLAARVAALELQVQALQRELRQINRLARSEGQEGASPSSSAYLAGKPPDFDYSALQGQSGYLGASATPPARPVSVNLPTSPSAGETFRTRADAGRWLARHGVNEHTPKTWAGWQGVALEPRPILEDAVSRYDPSNWRITWRLHRCGDPACVCAELLTASEEDGPR